MAKRISAIFFLTVIFSAFAVLCVRFSAGGADGLTLTLRALVDGEVSAQLEEAACENMPGHSMLHKLAVDARLFGGSAEIDGILVGDTMLMKNVQPPDDEIATKNKQSIIDLASFQEHPTYVMLLPTACAIKQQELPEYINLFNQRSYIDSVYTEMSGSVSVVDTYLKLLSGMEEYIYYRTTGAIWCMNSWACGWVFPRCVPWISSTSTIRMTTSMASCMSSFRWTGFSPTGCCCTAFPSTAGNTR